MRFEVPFLLIQVIGFSYALYLYGPRTAITTSVLLLYGPAASLLRLNVGGMVFPLGSLIALVGILFTIKSSIPKALMLYIISIFFFSLITAIMSVNTFIITMTLHFLIYTLCGLLLGNYIASREMSMQNSFLRCYCQLAGLYFIGIIFVRSILVDGTGIIHFRDVGFGLSPVFALFLVVLSRKNLFTAFGSLNYLLLSQTRSYLGLLVLGLFYGRKVIFAKSKRLGAFVLYFISLLMLFSIVYIRFSNIDSSLGDNANLAEKLSMISRLNGVLIEWKNFLTHPIFGNGIAYYEQEYRMQKLAEEAGKFTEFVAYNHVGIISVAAQGGIILFFLLVIVPLIIFRKVRHILFSNREPLGVGCLLLIFCYYISFFVSGSPVVKDYSDAILYYFAIGYLFRKWKSYRTY